MNVRAWYPSLVHGLTDAQIREVEKDLAHGYVASGRRPEPDLVQGMVEVVTGRRTTAELIEETLAEARAWVAEHPQG